MNNIRTYIVDDETDSIEVLTYHLNRISFVQICGSNTNAESALQEIQVLQPQLLFLDIQMPKLNGFELLEKLQPLKSKVIFLTAFDQFAIKAFKYSAVDYLLKPVNYLDLLEGVQRAKNQLTSNENIDLVLQNIKLIPTKKAKLSIPSQDGVVFFPIEEIIHCQSDNNYTHLFLTRNRKITASKTLKEFEHILDDESFVRVHQSHLVNLDYLEKFLKSDGGSLLLSNNQIIPVARAKKADLIKKLGL